MHRVNKIIDTLITAPAGDAMTLDHARRHIKSLSNDDDVLIRGWIAAAAQYFEEQTGRQIITATRERWIDAFPCYRQPLELPYPPLQSVTSVQYVASDGTVTDFVDTGSPASPLYVVKAPQGAHAGRGFIEPIYGSQWPQARCESGAVRIQYVCGYGDGPGDVPDLVQAILCFLVGHFDQYRMAVHEARRGQVIELPYGVQALVEGFKYSAYPRIPDPSGWSGWPAWGGWPWR